jgi:hypothetical protein
MAALVRRLAFVLLLVGPACACADDAPTPKQSAPPATAHRLAGPYSHANLTIFLVLGEDQMKGRKFVTLQEALSQKKATVYETQNVNNLAIENVSAEEVFVQAGDIVKGGQQDRVIAYDLIVPPHSGRMPLAAFCVEAGRWTVRGHEAVTHFDVSRDQVPTKELKAAVRLGKQQGEVWQEVDKAQKCLSGKLGESVNCPTSRTSLQLALEHPKLQATAESYVKALSAVVDKHADAIGYAAVINGVVSSADVYASPALFLKLWPTLLKGSSVEAVAELQKDKKPPVVDGAKVQAFLADAEKGKASTEQVTARVQLIQHKATKCLLFETREKEQPTPVRRSFVAH